MALDARHFESYFAEGVGIAPINFDIQVQAGIIEDFIGAALNTTDGKWATNTVETGGTPTAALVADTANGEVALTLEATDEVQRAELYWNDQLNIDVTKAPIIEMRVKFGTIAANEFAVVGLASARNNDPDAITTNAYFKLDAGMDIYIEGDDDTTNTDDVDSTIDAVADTYLWLKIDFGDLSNVTYYIDGVAVTTTIDMAAATGVLQPFCQIGKASGTGAPDLTVDVIKLTWTR